MFIDNLRVRVEKLEQAVFGRVNMTTSVIIKAPDGATNGTLTDENILDIANGADILLSGSRYTLYENNAPGGYLVYAHPHNGKFDKIYVTINTKAWVLVRG